MWFCADKRRTYRAAVDHAARDGDSGREVVALSLQLLVDLSDVSKFVTTLGCGSPGLYQLKNLMLDFVIYGGGTNGLEQGGQVVHKLSGGDLGEEVGAAILDACVGKLPSGLA